MPSRIMHDFLVHLIETCDVDMQSDPIEVRSMSGFQAMYMGNFPPRITLRRHLKFEEIHDLPANIYTEFIGLLEYLLRTGEAIDVNRRFRGVRLINMDTRLDTVSFGQDFYLEFTCESIDGEYDLSMTQRERMEIDRREREALLQEMMSQPRRTAMMPHDWFEDEKPKKVVKKKEDHFDKDLFEV